MQDEESTPIVRPYIPGTPLSPPSNVKLTYPISLSARAKYDYYVPKESFNLIGMFQNPMMMIMLFTGVMVLAMPYLMVRSGYQYDQPKFTEKYPEKHGPGDYGGVQGATCKDVRRSERVAKRGPHGRVRRYL